MPSLQPLNLRVSPDDWNELQKQLNYIIQDIYNYIDTIQGVDNQTFLPQSITLPDNFSVRFNNTGLQIYDTDGSNVLTVTVNSDLTADRTLTIVTGDSSRTITLNGDVTLNDWFDQAVKQASSVKHADITLSNLTALRMVFADSNKKLISIADLTAWIAGVAGKITVTSDGDGTITVSLAEVYEDIQVNISNVRVPASNAPTERLYAHGIAGGVTFPSYGFAVNNYIYFTIQSTHAMKLLSVLGEHIHFCTPTDGTGNKFKFQLDVITAAKDADYAVPAGSPFSAEHSIIADYTKKHKLFDIASVPAVNSTLSTLYKCKMTRIAASSNEYAGEVYVDFFDGHYIVDSNGSVSETSKT